MYYIPRSAVLIALSSLGLASHAFVIIRILSSKARITSLHVSLEWIVKDLCLDQLDGTHGSATVGFVRHTFQRVQHFELL